MWTIWGGFWNRLMAEANGDEGDGGAGDGDAGGVDKTPPEGQPADETLHGLPPKSGGDAGDGRGKTALDGGGAPRAEDFIPKKFQVEKDGHLDILASAQKLADSYSAAEKRIGSGDVPPKTAKDYQIDLKVDGVKLEDISGTPEYKTFLKEAHDAGMTNAQVNWALNTYVRDVMESSLATAELHKADAEQTLHAIWKDPVVYQDNIDNARRALRAFSPPSKNDEVLNSNIAKYGNDPDAVLMFAAIGARMREDVPAGVGTPVEAADFEVKDREFLDKLNTMDINDPRRKAVMDERDALHRRRYGGAFVS